MNLAAHYHRKRNAFLSHLFASAPINNQRAVHLPRSQTISNQETVKTFPKGRMGDLLSLGFVRRGCSGSTDINERLNLRDVLITMLMHYGGLRISECFHIWVEDIIHIEGRCIVKVYHPSQGLAPDGKSNRAAFLSKTYGLLPRTEYRRSSTLHAGWKDPLLTSSTAKFFVVNWFPLEAGDRFIRLWALYLMRQYQQPKDSYRHPYAFTTASGRPYSIKAYTASRKRAVERIGLEFSKEAGTTPHADRHSYGRALAKGGLRPEIIKSAMHHKSLESQSTYTQPCEKEIRDAFAEAEKILNQKILLTENEHD